MIIAAAAGGRGKWLLAAAGAAWLAAEWADPAAPGAVLFTVGLVTFLAPLPLVLASRWRQPVQDGSPAGSPSLWRQPLAGGDPAGPASRRRLLNAGGPVVLLTAAVLLATAVLLGA